MDDATRLKNEAARLAESSKGLAGLDYSKKIMNAHTGWRKDESSAEAAKRLREEVAELVRRGNILGGVNLTGMVEPGNIDIYSAPDARSISANVDGRAVLIPAIGDASDDEAIAQYKKTGKHFGIFDTPENATAYAQALSGGEDDQAVGSEEFLAQVLNEQRGGGGFVRTIKK